LVRQDDVSKNDALKQMFALFDESLWPPWIDQAHLRFGHPADLRTGMLSQDVALAYDWLYPSLSSAERQLILQGLYRRGIRPFLESIDQDPWWTHDLNNWLTVIVGGLGIAGMALGNDHPDAQKCIEISRPLMRCYLDIYGPEGEFNESVAYSNSTIYPVSYYLAWSYHADTPTNRLSQHPFPQTSIWSLYSTLPPGRYAAFGDSRPDAPAKVQYIAGVAAASRNAILQWFFLQHVQGGTDPLQLLWFDPSLQPVSPAKNLPVGKAFKHNGAQIISRSDWNMENSGLVVYGKAGREHNHSHNDIGQVCIDAKGERLVVDLGSPSGYPADYFEENRYKYYNASSRGHNVFMFGGREQRFPPWDRGKKTQVDYKAFSGEIIRSCFHDLNGGYWQLDLGNAYEGVLHVYRTVVHLFPAIVAVYDFARLEQEEDISLRWHIVNPSIVQNDGFFVVKNNKALLSARIVNVDGIMMELSSHRHEYQPPFDRNRLGECLEQRHEPYVQAMFRGQSCRIMTMFALTSRFCHWQGEKNMWTLESEDLFAKIVIDDDTLIVENNTNGTRLDVPII
jgi:hypothetical protein